jgi:GTP-binding protein
MFIDRARIKVSGGDGGNGCCSFRREKYVPRGGPNGGDGGKGGDVYFVATPRLTSLLDIKYHAHWKAERGEHGQGQDCHGHRGRDAEIPVPCGTIVIRLETEEAVADLVEEGQRFLAARGGKGGRGNARFKSNSNRAPRFAELGEPGEEFDYRLELKVIAEVGIVGKPNAGKSTLLSAISAARPKIGDYAFTTLSPNLGIAELSDHRTLTVADIPGIIEGAAEGKGLGHDFLRHIERTKVLLFLIDLGDDDPVATLELLRDELNQHSPVFAERPSVYALNKADITENRARAVEVAAAFPEDPFLISAATGEGLGPMIERLYEQVRSVRDEERAAVDLVPETEYTFQAPFTVDPEPGGFRVTGRGPWRAVQMTNFDNHEAVRHLHDVLRTMGVFKALERMGAKDGAAVRIEDFEFEYHPD